MKHSAFLDHLGVKTSFVGSKVVFQTKALDSDSNFDKSLNEVSNKISRQKRTP